MARKYVSLYQYDILLLKWYRCRPQQHINPQTYANESNFITFEHDDRPQLYSLLRQYHDTHPALNDNRSSMCSYKGVNMAIVGVLWPLLLRKLTRD